MADAQPYLEQTIRGELVNALQALYKEQPTKPFTFLAEYFSGLKEPKAEQKQPEKKEKKEKKQKKKKKVKIQKSDVVIECTPDTDVEFEWPDVVKAIQKIDLNGTMWAKDFPLQDFVFGMKKLVVVCQIVNAEVPTTSVIVEAILEIKGIGGAEMVSIQTAANDWGNKPKSKKNKQQQKQQKKGGKKNKKKKKKEEKKLEVTEKDLAVSAQKICIAASEAEFYVGGVSDMDRSGQLNCTVAQLEDVAARVAQKLPNLNLMIIAAGSSEVTIVTSVPDGRVSALEFANSTTLGSVGQGDAKLANCTHPCDPDKDEFPIKIKDIASANAFSFLKKQGVLNDGSEDIMYGLDDGEDEGY